MQHETATLVASTQDSAVANSWLPSFSLDLDGFFGSNVHVLRLLGTLDVVAWSDAHLLTCTEIQPHALGPRACALAVPIVGHQGTAHLGPHRRPDDAHASVFGKVSDLVSLGLCNLL